MLARCEQLVDGLRIGEHHECKTARNAGMGVDLHRDALDFAELAEVIPELLIGRIARQSTDKEFTFVVLTRDAGGWLMYRL